MSSKIFQKSNFLISPKQSLINPEGFASTLGCFLSFLEMFRIIFESQKKFHKKKILSQTMLNNALFALLSPYILWKPSKKAYFGPSFIGFSKKLVHTMSYRFWEINIYAYSRIFTDAFGEIKFLSLQIRIDVLTKPAISQLAFKIA